MADAGAVDAVNDIVRQAVEGINVKKRRQKLEIKGPTELEQQQQPQQPLLLTDRDVQHVVNLLQDHPRAVSSLFLEQCSLTLEAQEILRAYFATITRATSYLRHLCFDTVNLGNVNGGRLLSGLHGNNSVTRLELISVGLEGAAGGAIASALLQHNPHLITICCLGLRLGVEGARALQPGIRGNHTLRQLYLILCGLGDEGISLVVDALQGNTTITHVTLGTNDITSNGLPHLTRLLQNPSLRTMDFDSNPGLFDNQDSTRGFASALQNSQVAVLTLCHCRLPGHAISTLLQAIGFNKQLTNFQVYDNDQLQGADLEGLLEIIPQIRNLRKFRINLDFMAEAVLSSFHRNTTIQHLSTRTVTSPFQEVTSGPVFEILKRNRRLCQAKMLLDSEPRRTVPLGLWSTAIERLTCDDNTGATAVFKIMQEKLVIWWVPDTLTRTTAVLASSSAAAPSAAASSAATSSLMSSVKRSHAQTSVGHNDDGATDAKSSSSSTEPQSKRHRHHLSPSKSTDKESSTTATSTASMTMNNDTTNLDSLSRAELVELIKQKDEKNSQLVKIIKQKDEKIAQLVNAISQQDLKISDAMAVLAAKSSNNTEGGNMDDLDEGEEDQKMPAMATTFE